MAMESVGWRGLWLAVAGYTALSALALVHWVPSAAFGNQAGSLRLVRESLARPGALFLCLAFICYVGQWTSIMTWLPTFVVDERGASIGVAALVTAAFVAINIPGTLLGGLLLQRGHSRTAVLAGGALAMGTAAIGLFSSLPDGVRLACALAFSLVGGVIPTAVFAGTPVHAQSPAHIGTMNGMVMQASHLSQFVLPIVFAWVASRAGGWSASLGTLLVLAACGVFAALGVGRYERR
jgi:cyanate permease